MPITNAQETAFFERPFRSQETNAPQGSGLQLQACVEYSAASDFSRADMFLVFCGSRSGSRSQFEPVTIARHLQLRAKLEQQIRMPYTKTKVTKRDRSADFERPSEAERARPAHFDRLKTFTESEDF